MKQIQNTLQWLTCLLFGAMMLPTLADTESTAGDNSTDNQNEVIVELGQVNWLRDYDTAITQAKTNDLPLFMLFQEMPGCQGCRTYGQATMSHPLLVEAIENLFVPLAISNNSNGADQLICQRFEEPHWNYPVVRYLNANAEDLIPREDRIFRVDNTANRMVAALRAADKDVPMYLQCLRMEQPEDALSYVTVTTTCYWVGQVALGDLKGVAWARAGSQDRRELVLVAYDADMITTTELLGQINTIECATAVEVYNNNDLQIAEELFQRGSVTQAEQLPEVYENSNKNQYFRLQGTPLRHIPLTPTQASRLNVAIANQENWEIWLSPSQLVLVDRLLALHAIDKLASFDDLVFPDDVAELSSYQETLEARIVAAEQEHANPDE